MRPITDSPFPYRYTFGHTDKNDSQPSSKQQGQKLWRLNIGQKAIVWIVDRIELIVDTMIHILHISKRNIIEKKVIRVIRYDHSR